MELRVAPESLTDSLTGCGLVAQSVEQRPFNSKQGDFIFSRLQTSLVIKCYHVLGSIGVCHCIAVGCLLSGKINKRLISSRGDTKWGYKALFDAQTGRFSGRMFGRSVPVSPLF